MSTATVALKAKIDAALASIADELVAAEAAVAAERYIAALDAQASLEAGEVQSYSIAGRTITRRTSADGNALVSRLRTELYAYIYSPLSFIDMGGTA